MNFQSIPGQERAKRLLQNGLRADKLSHAYIFAGPHGSGRKEIARAFVGALFCSRNVDEACGECLECRKLAHGNHPDLTWVEPDGASIKIDQIRGLQQQFAYRSSSGGTKVYVLNEADRMTVQAANSLLKFLEEPQTPSIAILITENGQALLPTIQSRAQWVPFLPLPPEQMKPPLLAEGLPEELVHVAVHLASGLEAARKLIQINWFAETRNVMIQLMKDLASKQPFAVSVQQKVMKSEVADHLDTLFDMIMLWYKDMIHVSFGRKSSIVYIDQADWLAKQAFTRDADGWVRCMERAVEARKRLRSNANAQLVLEQFLIGVK
ncbi:DNA polymerase III subunit delta' [Paenibacillus flagellatus]|uniref:DNA polymerase III subunit delta' n=1 Tax=Paenibacillus flagellatus TaxID=2211139 RepID=A0A2V5JUF1_9BACL|nr:DNA polymerase III subunit delta' [Paenibacillus flagellatus]PYI50199.1 DNA polymerase III subunit delta' [Paenibacillus flagellatus]